MTGEYRIGMPDTWDTAMICCREKSRGAMYRAFA
jgi:hypothetical protein